MTPQLFLWLINIGLGSNKNNALLNLIRSQRPAVANIHFYIKERFESKYQFMINQRDKIEINKLKNPETFIDYSQKIDDILEILEDCIPGN